MKHINTKFKLTIIATILMAFAQNTLADNEYVFVSRYKIAGGDPDQGRIKAISDKYNFISDNKKYSYLSFYIGKSLDSMTNERQYEVGANDGGTSLILGQKGSTISLPGNNNIDSSVGYNFLSYTNTGGSTIGILNSRINFNAVKIGGSVKPSGLFLLGSKIKFLYGGLSSVASLSLPEQSSAVTTYSNNGLFENFGTITALGKSNVLINSASYDKNINTQFIFHNVGTLDLEPLSTGFKLSSGASTDIINDGTIKINQSYNVVKRFTSSTGSLRFINRGIIDVVKPRYGGVIIDDDLQEKKASKEIKASSFVINDTNGKIFARNLNDMKGRYLFSLNDNGTLVNKGVIQGPIYTAGLLVNTGIIDGDLTFDRNAALYLKGRKQQLPSLVVGNASGNNVIFLNDTLVKNTEIQKFNTLYVINDSTIEKSTITLDTKPDAKVNNTNSSDFVKQIEQKDPVDYANTILNDLDNSIASQRKDAQAKATETITKANIKGHTEYADVAQIPDGKPVLDNTANPNPNLVVSATPPTSKTLTLKDSIITINPDSKDNIVADKLEFTGKNTIRLTKPISSGYKLSDSMTVNSIIGNVYGIVGNIFGQWEPTSGGTDLIYTQRRPEQVIDASLLPLYNQLSKNTDVNNFFNTSRTHNELRKNILRVTGYEYGYLFDSFAHRLNNIGGIDQFYTGDNVPANLTNLAVSYQDNHNAEGQAYNHSGNYDPNKALADNTSYIRNYDKTLVINYNKEVWPYYFDNEPYANIALYGIYGQTDSDFETNSTAKSTNFGLGSKITYHLFDRRLDLFTDIRIQRSNITLNRDSFSQDENGQYTNHTVSNDYFIQGFHTEAGFNFALFNYYNWSLLTNGSYAYSRMTQSVSIEAPNNPRDKIGLLNRGGEFSRESQVVNFGGALNYRGFLGNAPYYFETGVNSTYEFGNLRNAYINELVDPNKQKEDLLVTYKTNYNPLATNLYLKTQILLNSYLSVDLGYKYLFAKGSSDSQFYSSLTVNTDILNDVLAPFNKVSANNLKEYRGSFAVGAGITLPMHKEPYYTNKGYIFYYNYPILTNYSPNFEYKLTKPKDDDFLVDIKGNGSYNFSNNWGINKQLKVNSLTAKFEDTHYKIEAGAGSSYKNDDYQAQGSLLAVGLYNSLLAGFKYDYNTYASLNPYIKNAKGEDTSDYTKVPANNSGIRVENQYNTNNLDFRLGYSHTWNPARGKLLTESYFNLNGLNNTNQAIKNPTLTKPTKVQLVNHIKTDDFTLTHNFLGELFVKLDNFFIYNFSNKLFTTHLDQQVIFKSATYWNFFSYKLQYNQTDDFYKDELFNKNRHREATVQASVNFKFANGNILNVYYNDKIQNYTVIDGDKYLFINTDKTKTIKSLPQVKRQYKIGSKYQQLGFNYTTTIIPQLTLKVGMQYMLLNYFEPTYSSMSGNFTLTYNF